MPEICMFLALVIYWLCFGTSNTGAGRGRVFPGGTQFDRFRKIMSRFLEEDATARRLHQLGMTAGEIGTHSMRKGRALAGAATYCCSVSTGGPSLAQICIRA
eukprot:700813-Hanusia_phi.AAC.1